MKSRVFIIQDSAGKNFEPAKEFGELTIILTGRETVIEAINRLEHYLESFTGDDYLLLVGSPLFIGIASALAWNLCLSGHIQFLVWDREHYKYNVEKVELC